jgi:hypothetical protein
LVVVGGIRPSSKSVVVGDVRSVDAGDEVEERSAVKKDRRQDEEGDGVKGIEAQKSAELCKVIAWQRAGRRRRKIGEERRW